MVDVVDRETRSRMMAAIGPANTGPELAVRRYLHATGLRFRVHDRALPGRPDIVLPRHRVAVFVHGCFWHRHRGCRFATVPASNTRFWQQKFERNVQRDEEKIAALERLGWAVIVVWECEVKAAENLDWLYWLIRSVSAESESSRRRIGGL